MKSFTLIELLVVIVIIGILAAILILFLGSTPFMKARDAKRLFDVQNMRLGLTLYRLDMNGYPTSLEELIPVYIPVVPIDPRDHLTGCGETNYDPDGLGAGYLPGDYGYSYTQLGGGDGYFLQTCLEVDNPALESDRQDPPSGQEFVYDTGVEP
jgi:general secretion pathway protein G